MIDFETQRYEMVERQIRRRGVDDDAILRAMEEVPREWFVREDLREFAYDDAPLPIGEGQTISQPFIVALMAHALDLKPSDRLLEVGAGSGYAAAVLSRIVAEAYGIERHGVLADQAARRLRDLGYDNVEILHADGTRGWAELAPFDAILVSAGGPDVPKSLREQLAIGGRLVIPVGPEPRAQELVKVTRVGEHEFEEVSLGRVQFVPLIGTEGWGTPDAAVKRSHAPAAKAPRRLDGSDVVQAVLADAEPFGPIEDAPLDGLLDRIGDARVVLIGEATHGTSEFYELRAKITRALVRERGFDIVAIEADWPDVARVDRYTRGLPGASLREPPFSRFPRWMWRNEEMRRFLRWLERHNAALAQHEKVRMVGLDLYSLNNSIGAVLDYLDAVDEDASEAARVRLSCFSPWETDPAVYGRAALMGETRRCESDVVGLLRSMMERRVEYTERDGDAFFDAQQNAQLIVDAERYYRVMYSGGRDAWNLRDTHMFQTMQAALDHHGEDSKAVVWAHNSHVGNAAATEMGARGEHNIGQLAREAYGHRSYNIGFGTHAGRVAAATNWNEPVQFMDVQPSHEGSYERLFHETDEPRFFLPLRAEASPDARPALMEPRLERAIGVVYRPRTELLSHYFQAVLPVQFDEFIWFDTTRAVAPLDREAVSSVAETFPFGL